MPKLTAKQQEVVSLMAEGWKFHWHREAFGGRIPASATLHKGNDSQQLSRADTVISLVRKGVIEKAAEQPHTMGHFLPAVVYVLTAAALAAFNEKENL